MPALGRRRPLTARAMVDLPAPLVPSRAQMPPAGDFEVDAEDDLHPAVPTSRPRTDSAGRGGYQRPFLKGCTCRKQLTSPLPQSGCHWITA